MSVLYVSVTKGPSGDGCNLVSTLCTYELRKGGLFLLSWVRVRRGSISSELLMCGGGGVCSMLFLSPVARCLETIDACIWHICYSDCLLCSSHC